MTPSPAFLKIVKDLEKKYPGTFRKATGWADPRRIPSGVFHLDRALRGGFPVRRITLIGGHKASYKTTLATKAIANWQRNCTLCMRPPAWCVCDPDTTKPMFAVVIDVEHTFDEAHAVELGVDPERLYVAKPVSGEAACEYAETIAHTPDVGIEVVDSLAALAPDVDLSKSYMTSAARGLRARLIARLMRALTVKLDKPRFPCTAIILNHLLPSQDGMGDIWPGGETQKYLSSVVIKLTTFGKEILEIQTDGEEMVKPYGGKAKPLVGPRMEHIRFLIEHSKVSLGSRLAEFDMVIETGDGFTFGDIDDYDDVLKVAQRLGIVKLLRGSDYDVNGQVVHTLQGIRGGWAADPEGYTLLKAQLCGMTPGKLALVLPEDPARSLDLERLNGKGQTAGDQEVSNELLA